MPHHLKPQRAWSSVVLSAPITLALSALSLFVFLIPSASALLELDVALAAAGQWWRLLTGHLVHWSGDHLVWDLGVFALLGYLCEMRHRWLTVSTLATSAVLISLACGLYLDIDSYRGLSGLDTALFALLGTRLLQDKIRERDLPAIGLFTGLLAAMLGKIFFEVVTGDCLFVDVAASGFTPIPLAHLIGAVVGVSVACHEHFVTAFVALDRRVSLPCHREPGTEPAGAGLPVLRRKPRHGCVKQSES